MTWIATRSDNVTIQTKVSHLPKPPILTRDNLCDRQCVILCFPQKLLSNYLLRKWSFFKAASLVITHRNHGTAIGIVASDAP